MRRTVILIAMMLVAAVCPDLFAQRILTGQVLDQKGQPISHVTVLSAEIEQATETDDEGEFSVTATVSGPIRFTFSHAGYIPRTVKVEPQEESVTVVMAEQVYPMEGVTVTAGRATSGKSPVTFTNIDRETIDRNYDIGDIPALLETTPNLYSYSESGGGLGYSYLSIRGFDARRIPVYINSVPLNDPEDHALYFVDLPDLASDIDDIQVQRGVGNSLYGDAAFGGSINLLTSSLSRPRRFVSEFGYGAFYFNGSTIGLMRKQSASYSTGLLPGGWAVSLRWSRETSHGYRKQSWHDATGYFLSLGRVDPRMVTTINIYGGPMKTHAAWWWADRETLYLDRRYNYSTYPNETDNFNQPHVEFHNIYRLRDNISLHNSLYYIRGSGYYEEFKNERKLAEYNFHDTLIVHDSLGAPDTLTRIDLIRRKWVTKNQYGINSRVVVEGEHHRTAFGGSYYYFDSDHWGEAMLWGKLNAGINEGTHRYYEHFGRHNNFSVFASREQQITEKLSAQGEIQLKYLTINFHQTPMGVYRGYIYDLDWLFASPHIGLNYSISNDVSTYASFSIASHEPNDDMIYDADEPDDVPRLTEFGQKEVKAERVYDVEAGAAYRAQDVTVNVNLFWMDYQNELIFSGVNPDGSRRYDNVDRSFHRGAEASAAWRIISSLTLKGDYSFNDNRVDEYYQAPFDRTFRDFPTPGFPRFLGNLIIDYAQGPINVIYRLRGVGRQFIDFTGDRDRSVAPYAVSSIRASVTLKHIIPAGHLILEGRVDNLLNQRYEQAGMYDPEWDWYYYLPAAERNWFVNVKLTI